MNTLTFVPSVQVNASNYALGLAGEHQKSNAILARECCQKWILNTAEARNDAMDEKAFEDAVIVGLKETRWPGRSQIMKLDGGFTLYLDGAHTDDSMAACIAWYKTQIEQTK